MSGTALSFFGNGEANTHHRTGVRDATAGTLSLYVDGEKVATQRVCTAPVTTGDTVIGPGQYGGEKVDYLRGDVDDVRIFNRALSDAEFAEVAAQRRRSASPDERKRRSIHDQQSDRLDGVRPGL